MYYKREGGLYRYVKTYTDERTGKRRTVSVCLGDCRRGTQSRAEKMLDAMIDDRQRARDETVTLGRLCVLYTEYQTAVLREQTARSNAGHLRAVCRILGEDTPVDSMTAGGVTRAILAADSTPSLRNGHICRLRALIRWGYRQGYVQDMTWLSGLDRYKDSAGRERLAEKYMEPDEVAAVLDAMRPCKKWYLLTQFLLLTGLRVGEAIALTRADVDLTNRRIYVNKTYVLTLGKVSQTPKTDTSRREVYIQDELVPVVGEIFDYFRRVRRSRGIYGCPLFFHEEDGTYIRHNSYGKYFRELTERTLGRRLTPHALRHTHTSLLAAAGVPLDTISRRLGHRDSKITRSVYLHVTSGLQQSDDAAVREIALITNKNDRKAKSAMTK